MKGYIVSATLSLRKPASIITGESWQRLQHHSTILVLSVHLVPSGAFFFCRLRRRHRFLHLQRIATQWPMRREEVIAIALVRVRTGRVLTSPLLIVLTLHTLTACTLVADGSIEARCTFIARPPIYVASGARDDFCG